MNSERVGKSSILLPQFCSRGSIHYMMIERNDRSSYHWILFLFWRFNRDIFRLLRFLFFLSGTFSITVLLWLGVSGFFWNCRVGFERGTLGCCDFCHRCCVLLQPSLLLLLHAVTCRLSHSTKSSFALLIMITHKIFETTFHGFCYTFVSRFFPLVSFDAILDIGLSLNVHLLILLCQIIE